MRRREWIRVGAAVLVGSAALTMGGLRPVAAAPREVRAAQAASQVTVVHGLRGLLVDVTLDGAVLLESFEPDRLTDPMAVPAGPHRLELRPGGSAPGTPPKFAADLDVPAGRNLAVVAHFAPDGAWTATVYGNDPEGATPPGAGNVVFRNNATTTPVDVKVDGATIVAALANPDESRQALAAAPHSVEVSTSGAGALVLPANDVSVGAGDTTFLYLVGTGDAVTWLTQQVGAPRALPASISAGDGSLAGASNSGPIVPWWVAVLVALVVTAALIDWSRRRTDLPRPHAR